MIVWKKVIRMNLNNKGQVLVAFVIILQIVLFLLVSIIDIGLYGIEKRNISDNVKSSVRYGVKNIKDDNIEAKVRAILMKNIDDLKESDVNITISDNYIKVTVNKDYKPLFKFNRLSTNVSYSGSISNSKIELKKE